MPVNIDRAVSRLERIGREASQRAQIRADRLRKRISLEVINALFMNTPVRTGRLAGSWQAGESLSVPGNRALNRSRMAPGSLISAVLSVDPQRPILIGNHAPYASFVERGTSRFSGRRFTRLSVMAALRFNNMRGVTVRVT